MPPEVKPPMSPQELWDTAPHPHCGWCAHAKPARELPDQYWNCTASNRRPASKRRVATGGTPPEWCPLRSEVQ